MIKIIKQINRDVAGFKDDFYKGLTLRECLYGFGALGIGVGGMLTLIFIYKANVNLAIMICMPFVSGVGLCGFYEKNGMTLPKIIRAFYRIKKQKTLTYKTNKPDSKPKVRKNEVRKRGQYYVKNH